MSTATPATRSMGGGSTAASPARFVKRNGWVIGLWVLLGLLHRYSPRSIQPNWGASAFAILTLAALPYAFATAGQTIAVITGGIDLSIAAMITFISVTAAVLMQGQSEEFGLVAVVLVLLMGLLVGTINGLSVVLTRVPDIVVTLAFFFIWEGAALMVLDHPGGATSQWLKELILGTVGADFLPAEITSWAPKALVIMIVALGIVWIPLKRSRLGLSMYAVGIDRLAAFRSGVPVDRTRVVAYSLAGLFAAMGGLAIVMNTGVGTPIQGPYLLASVAAVVLGGVSLAGGKGGLVGPIVAVLILRLVAPGPHLPVHRPQRLPQVIEGTMLVGWSCSAASWPIRNRRIMTSHETQAASAQRSAVGLSSLSGADARQAHHPADQCCWPPWSCCSATHPAGHRQRTLGRQHAQGRRATGHPRGCADTDDVDWWHRPIGRRGRHHERLRDDLPGQQHGPVLAIPLSLVPRSAGRTGERYRHRHLPRPPLIMTLAWAWS